MLQKLETGYRSKMTKDVFGTKVKYIKQDLGPDTDGEYNTIDKTISINTRLKKEEIPETRLHEEIHAIIDVLGFTSRISDDVEELLIGNISSWIAKNYRLIEKK